MNKEELGFRISVMIAALTRRMKPLLVSWILTYKCDKNCIYCGTRYKFDNSGEELSAPEVCGYIDALSRLGTKYITFTGGEPLLKEGIEEIVSAASKAKMLIKINSNGGLWHKYKGLIRKLHKIQLSLDGPQEIHDRLRGKNSFHEVIKSAQLIKEQGGDLYFSTVLTQENHMYVDWLLALAKDLKVKVLFQPISPPVNTEVPGIKDIFLSFLQSRQYKQAIAHIARLKSTRNSTIMNSQSGIKYLSQLPEGQPNPYKVRCCAGKHYFRITPRGEVYGCVVRYAPHALNNKDSLILRLKETGVVMPEFMCKSCYCAGLVETNLLFSLDINAILNALTI